MVYDSALQTKGHSQTRGDRHELFTGERSRQQCQEHEVVCCRLPWDRSGQIAHGSMAVVIIDEFKGRPLQTPTKRRMQDSKGEQNPYQIMC